MAAAAGPPPPMEGRSPRPPDPDGEDSHVGTQQQDQRQQYTPLEQPETVWTTEGVAELRTNLAHSADPITPDAELARLREISTAVYPLHEDSALRQLTEKEATALEAYVSRRLELPAPPTFFSWTATAVKRATLLAFHHEHVVIADVPANARLGNHIPRQSLLRELVAGNTSDAKGRKRMKSFIKEAQRVTFDGDHTLMLVCMSAVVRPTGEVFRIRGLRIQFHLVEVPQAGICQPPQLARNYALQGLGTEGLNKTIQLLEGITRTQVLDIRHPGTQGLALANNDYWTVIFASKTCPAAIQGLTAILVDGLELMLHHFQSSQHPPCWTCLSPKHMQARCKVPSATLPYAWANQLREYTGGTSAQSPPLLTDCRDLATLNRFLSDLVDSESDDGLGEDTVVTKAMDNDPDGLKEEGSASYSSAPRARLPGPDQGHGPIATLGSPQEDIDMDSLRDLLGRQDGQGNHDLFARWAPVWTGDPAYRGPEYSRPR
ncbi:unnamed protein product [Phytophthora fragariaefolia]|uniref:Unnamed protein product n=1 Tax=Phytophthora fragariaefolia TaxID=1490495 RepID=A0A9W7CZC4_9STRA|nr:unnamed protein product [Phytophthora fragariaefolia]